MPKVVIAAPVSLTVDVTAGTPVSVLAQRYQDRFASTIVICRIGNRLRELNTTLDEDCTVELMDLTTSDGARVYERGVAFLFVRAARDTLPGCRATLEHHISNGLYGEVHYDRPVTAGDYESIEERMTALVREDVPFERLVMARDDAKRMFEADGQADKVRLLATGTREQVKVYRCGWCYDSFYGYMVPSAGYLTNFRIRAYLPGFIIELPDLKRPGSIPEFVEQGKLAAVFGEAERWGRILGVGDVGQLNQHVLAGVGGDLVLVAEALHEKKVAQMADAIAAEKERLRVVLIAGPSSSGKTTFAQRLSVQMRVNGLRPVSISLDDYFVSRAETPLDDEGKPDFEALEAIDISLFNEDLQRLIQGEAVNLPTFNFVTGRREYGGRTIKISSDQPILIEGIHGLNDRLTESIPTGNKFRVYVSALTTLNVDDHNRIPTTDVRLLRRIVRDSQFRSHDALQTLRMWPSVRRGEKRDIFPYQENADVMFNSALVYELSVLKAYAEPLLEAVLPDVAEHSEARRLLGFVSYFRAMDEGTCSIPQNSVIREFIGGSCFV